MFRDDLALLQARGLLRTAANHDRPLVSFKHALTREATYNSMLQARRSQLHRVVAHTLTRYYAQPDLDTVLILADHWQHAGDDNQALETLLPRTRNLIYTGRGLTLSALLDRLDRAALSPPRQRDLDIALADAHAALGDNEQVRQLYERALAESESDELRVRLFFGIGVSNYHLGNFREAIRYFEQSLEIAEHLNDATTKANAQSSMGLAYWRLGERKRALELLDRSYKISRSIGESLELANIELNIAGILFEQGDYEKAISNGEQALFLYDKFNHQGYKARTLQLLGACYHSRHELDRAKLYYERALAASRSVADRAGIGLGFGNLAELYADSNDFAQAIEYYDRAIAEFRTIHNDYLLQLNLIDLARLQLRLTKQGKGSYLASALQHGLEAKEIGLRLQTHDGLGLAQQTLAEIYAQSGNISLALEFGEAALGTFENLGDTKELKRTYQILAELGAASDDPELRERAARYLDLAKDGGTP